jgi:hypothetical protein
MATDLEGAPVGVVGERSEKRVEKGRRNVLEVLKSHPGIVDALVKDRNLENSDELLKDGGLEKIFPGMNLRIMDKLGALIAKNPGSAVRINRFMQQELGYPKEVPDAGHATDKQLKERLAARHYTIQELTDAIRFNKEQIEKIESDTEMSKDDKYYNSDAALRIIENHEEKLRWPEKRQKEDEAELISRLAHKLGKSEIPVE